MAEDPLTCIRPALSRLDLLLHREILRLRGRYQLSLDEFRGLYISDEQVDALVNRRRGDAGPAGTIEEMTHRAVLMRNAEREADAKESPWSRIRTAFSLTEEERDVLLTAVAPSIDAKYETLYAYLNNDVGRAYPTFDLVMRLFADSEPDRPRLRACLDDGSRLFDRGVLRTHRDPSRLRSWLSTGFGPRPAVIQFLQGRTIVEGELRRSVWVHEGTVEWDDVDIDPALGERLRRLANLPALKAADDAPIVALLGADRVVSTDVAACVCRAMNKPLLVVDGGSVQRPLESLRTLFNDLLFHQGLFGAGVLLRGFEWVGANEGNPTPEQTALPLFVSRLHGPLFIATFPGAMPRWSALQRRVLSFELELPSFARRTALWEEGLACRGHEAPEGAASELAERFVMTAAQIRHALENAADRASLSSDRGTLPDRELLFDSARERSGGDLGRLAVRVRATRGWESLVVPSSTHRRLREITNAMKYRNLVYRQWGFAERVSYGRSLTVLFTGAPGTGKTMTAGIMARELGIDAFKIDLSGVVSKYIGETEKNLDRIFNAALHSNAILFFDEADALFGKRSEVKDAHDRYANIEVAYLLQKLEEHDGIVILASNLPSNIDQAFARRVLFSVEFPLPDAERRERLWRGMFAGDVPVDDAIDFGFIARQFSLSGGDIRNVALDAAFLAAQDGRVVTMKHVVSALSRQVMKQGKMPSTAEFKQYHELLDR